MLPSPLRDVFIEKVQIIRRSRENHLMDKFRSNATGLTSELIAEIEEAWRMYLRSQLEKALDEAELPKAGSELDSWTEILSKSQNAEWKLERSRKDEKFDMHLKALVSGL